MKHQIQSDHLKNHHPVNAQTPAAEVESKHNGIEFGPSRHDVAKRAYYIYLNHGSLPGYDLLHWQEAEAQLVEECNCMLDRGVPKSSKK